jgi:hypothetical protein
MNGAEIINLVIVGGLLGLLGQGIRMAVGLKKLSDANAAKPFEPNETADTSRLRTSLFIGAVAGALYLLVHGKQQEYAPDFIFTVIAAGYAGADFIEGFFNTYLNKIGTPQTNASDLKNTLETKKMEDALVIDEAVANHDTKG